MKVQLVPVVAPAGQASAVRGDLPSLPRIGELPHVNLEISGLVALVGNEASVRREHCVVNDIWLLGEERSRNPAVPGAL